MYYTLGYGVAFFMSYDIIKIRGDDMGFVLTSFEITMLHMCLDVFLLIIFITLCASLLGALIKVFGGKK